MGYAKGGELDAWRAAGARPGSAFRWMAGREEVGREGGSGRGRRAFGRGRRSSVVGRLFGCTVGRLGVWSGVRALTHSHIRAGRLSGVRFGLPMGNSGAIRDTHHFGTPNSMRDTRDFSFGQFWTVLDTHQSGARINERDFGHPCFIRRARLEKWVSRIAAAQDGCPGFVLTRRGGASSGCPALVRPRMGVQFSDGAGSHACFVSPARAWIEWPIAYRWPGGLGDEGASLPRATLRASHSLGPGLPPVVHLRRTFPKPSIVGLDVCGYAVFKHARAACGDAKACRTELLQFSSFGHPSIWGAH